MVSLAPIAYGSPQPAPDPRIIRDGAGSHMLGSYTTRCTGPTNKLKTATRSGNSVLRSQLWGHHAPSMAPGRVERSHNASRVALERGGAICTISGAPVG